MKDNLCYLCGGSDFTRVADRVRDNSNIAVLRCNACGLVFLSSFDHIDDTFYENSEMNLQQGLEDWVSQTRLDDERRYKLLEPLLEGKRLLDFGAGNCGFVLRASLVVKRAVAVEPSGRVSEWFRKNQLAKQVELHKDISDLTTEKFDIITMFHVIEHLRDPRVILIKLSSLLSDEGQIFIETPNSEEVLLSLYKSDRYSFFTYWSCHLFLYNYRTLPVLASQAGLKTNYIRQVQRYPLSNHLYWLAEGKPCGHMCWNFLDSDVLNLEYEKQLATVGKCDTIFGSFGIA